MGASKYTVLYLGDDIKYNHDVYKQFSSVFDIIQPPAEQRERSEFIRALKEKRWGNFHAIFRPFWNSGGEMGRWDAELISLLPDSVKISTSAGAGYDWVDVDVLAKRGNPFHIADFVKSQLTNKTPKESCIATEPPRRRNPSQTWRSS